MSPSIRTCRLVLAVLMGVLRPVLFAADPIPDADCLECHSDKDLTKTNAQGATVSLFVDPAILKASPHATNTCASCHGDIGTGHPDDAVAPKPVDCSTCHQEALESYGASVHGRALRADTPGAATCTDCHGAHDILSHASDDARINPRHITSTCGSCHVGVARDVQRSVHGKALAEGRRDAPLCTDCHSEHRIEALEGQSPIRVAERTCSRCHASERINTKYRMPGDRVKTFLGSYHGLAAQLGSTEAANCASCHGFHLILPSTDPASSIHPNHLVETCGKCHPGANENFALGKVHVDDDTQDGGVGTTVNYWVRRLYQCFIAVTIGVLLLHNLLTWWRKALAARPFAGDEVRMDHNQRVQHGILVISFVLLTISGFALKYPDSWLAWVLGSDEFIRRWSHRVSALVLIGLAAYHVAYVLFTPTGRSVLKGMLWMRKADFRDMYSSFRFMTGRATATTHTNRFTYIEKFEYWGVVWGVIIMGVTGFMIWFPVQVTRFLPRWAVDVATTIHFYEAILACLSILVWHFYHVIFDPDVYPINWAFWHGHAPRPHGQPAAPTPTAPAPGAEDPKR